MTLEAAQQRSDDLFLGSRNHAPSLSFRGIADEASARRHLTCGVVLA